MNQQTTPSSSSAADRAENHFPPPLPLRVKLLRLFCVLLLLGAGAGLWFYFTSTGPKARQITPPVRAILVEAITLEQKSLPIAIETTGTVIPARELVLKSRVAGQIMEVHDNFVPGGFLRAGQRILSIDPKDYQLAVAARERDLVEARYKLELEMGHQAVAAREWEMLGSSIKQDVDKNLALRKPHLEKALADVDAAKAALEKARLDLARTVVEAPFNAVVQERLVTKGSQVAAHESLAKLVDTDSFYIQASVTLAQLARIAPYGEKGYGPNAPKASVFVQGNPEPRSARLVKILPDLSPEGRLARVLVEVKDPLKLENQPLPSPALLIGQFVRVTIEGQLIEGVFPIPRTAFRDGATIWIADPDNRLEIRPVEPVYSDSGFVFVRQGLEEGERLIVSDIPAPVPGLALRFAGEASPDEPGRGKGKNPGQGPNP
ncbi:MAG: efflux RND transporter periplasmic adaptor subunit [Desulfatibacillaceae bacterium]|nr:efflux RND transporter periplasmic adaptor subunit [Desulfatibacillaceae bacterium]